MGVNQLWNVLSPACEPCHLTSLQGKTLAVDLSGWVVASQNHTSLEYMKNPHLRNLFFRVSYLLQIGVNLMFVTEGEAPVLKYEVMSQRNNARYRGSYKISAQKGNRSHFKAVLKECQDMLESLGIHSVESKGEAEAMCAFLNQCGVVDGCITEDSDFFLYGGLVAYRDFSIDTKLSKVHMYCMTNIETRLKLDRKKLIGLAVLLGCDYLPKGVPGVGKETAVKLMQKFEDVDVIQRFHEWRNDNKFKKPKLPQTAKKLTHCELCNHPGTEKQHVAKGCIFCGSELSCHQGTDDQECPCDWHGALKLRTDQGLELSVREKALRVPEFPFPQVIEEYLNYQDHLPKETVKWKSPKWTLFQPFTEAKLKWPVKYCWEKYLPLLTLWQLKTVLKSSECTTVKLNPIRIQKRKTVKGVRCFQVEWCKTANEDLPDDVLYVTVESETLFSMAYSSVTEKFVTEEKRKKCKTVNKPSPEDKEKNVVPVVCKGKEPRVRRRTQDAKNPGCKEEPRMQRHLKSSSKEKESLDTHRKHQVGVNTNSLDTHRKHQMVKFKPVLSKFTRLQLSRASCGRGTTTYMGMVTAALTVCRGQTKGVSKQQIENFLRSNYRVPSNIRCFKSSLKKALLQGISKGVFQKISGPKTGMNGSYSLLHHSKV